MHVYKTLPIFGLRRGPWTIANYVLKILVPPVTVYTELEIICPLVLIFQSFTGAFSPCLNEKV